MELDVSEYKSINEFADKIQKKYDHIDVLINNAGIVNKRSMEIDAYKIPGNKTSGLIMSNINTDTTNKVGDFATGIQTPGGNLRVSFTKADAGTAEQVILTGAATFVFKGELP